MRHYFNKRAIFIFSVPALLLFTIFAIYPIIPEIQISFQSHNGIAAGGWVGFNNYKNILQSSSFWRAHKNTYIIVLSSLLIALPVSLLLALMLDRTSDRVRKIFKFGALFPAILSVTVIGKMWVAAFEPQWGLLNKILEMLHLDLLINNWLSNEKTAIWCIAFAFLWQYVGLNCILFYAGIKAIPKQYYEAAMIDGAGFLKSSIKITIPLLQDIVKYVVITSTLGSRGMYAHILIMTNGGPGDASRSVLYQMYYKAFLMGQFGEGSAIAVLFIIQCIIISILINRTIAKEKIEF